MKRKLEDFTGNNDPKKRKIQETQRILPIFPPPPNVPPLEVLQPKKSDLMRTFFPISEIEKLARNAEIDLECLFEVVHQVYPIKTLTPEGFVSTLLEQFDELVQDRFISSVRNDLREYFQLKDKDKKTPTLTEKVSSKRGKRKKGEKTEGKKLRVHENRVIHQLHEKDDFNILFKLLVQFMDKRGGIYAKSTEKKKHKRFIELVEEILKLLCVSFRVVSLGLEKFGEMGKEVPGSSCKELLEKLQEMIHKFFKFSKMVQNDVYANYFFYQLRKDENYKKFSGIVSKKSSESFSSFDEVNKDDFNDEIEKDLIEEIKIYDISYCFEWHNEKLIEKRHISERRRFSKEFFDHFNKN